MAKRVKNQNLVGEKINNILIVEYFRENRRSYFKCQCVCGNYFITRCEHIKGGLTKSCGCLTGILVAKQTTAKNNANQINSLFRSYKHNATSRNLEFNLSLEDFIKIIKQNCHYCKVEPKQIWIANKKRKNYFNEPLIYNGIDRINSDIGYTLENSLPCCAICNLGKNNLSYNEFMEWINRIVKFRTNIEIAPIEENFSHKDAVNDILNHTNNEVGDYGYLTIISEEIKEDGKSGFLCKCICGKEIFRRKDMLISGRVKSCGCMKGVLHSRKTTKPNGHSQFMKLFNFYKGGAKTRNIFFNLTFELFQSLIIKNCFYCGAPPKKFEMKGFGRKNYNMEPIYYNGIDRLNSNDVYNVENCVSCCMICNYAKNDMNYEEFLIYINRLVSVYNV